MPWERRHPCLLTLREKWQAGMPGLPRTPMNLQLAFIGFGNVARAFARMLAQHELELEFTYGLRWQTTAIATASHGCITSEAGIDLIQAAACVERGGDLAELAESIAA